MKYLVDGKETTEQEAIDRLEMGGDVIFENSTGKVLIQYFCHAYELIVNGEVMATVNNENDSLSESALNALRMAPKVLFEGEAEVDNLLIPFRFPKPLYMSHEEHNDILSQSREKIRKALELYSRFTREMQKVQQEDVNIDIRLFDSV